jgi:hypothetical protein
MTTPIEEKTVTGITEDEDEIEYKPSPQVDECFIEVMRVIEDCLPKLTEEEQVEFAVSLRAQLGAIRDRVF